MKPPAQSRYRIFPSLPKVLTSRLWQPPIFFFSSCSAFSRMSFISISHFKTVFLRPLTGLRYCSYPSLCTISACGVYGCVCLGICLWVVAWRWSWVHGCRLQYNSQRPGKQCDCHRCAQHVNVAENAGKGRCRLSQLPLSQYHWLFMKCTVF